MTIVMIILLLQILITILFALDIRRRVNIPNPLFSP